MRKRKLYMLFLFLLLFVTAAGCGEKKKRITDGSEVYVKREETEAPEETEEEEQDLQALYVVTGIDTDHQLLTLRDCETAKEKPYHYTGGTYIKNKYGDNLAIGQLSLGELVTIEEKNETLTAVQISEETFSYDDLYNFTLDTEMKSLTVGAESYYFDENLLIYHENSKISVSEVSEQDTISMKGVGQHIYVIQVMTGHGTVVLENTELFQGGYITIGNILSRKITPQMRLEVPEGTYLLAVANNGYGGSRNITVEANRELKVNLDELKGEGPKVCQIQFKATPENAVVKLDGEQVQLGQTVSVTYGAHKLTAEAEGYTDWNKTLIVNSATAEISIELTSQEEEEKDETISTSGNDNNSNSTTGGNNNNTTGNNTTNNNRNNITNNNRNNSNNNSNNNNNKNNNNNNNKNNSNNNNNRNNNKNNRNDSGGNNNNKSDDNSGNSSNNSNDDTGSNNDNTGSGRIDGGVS
ncbi:PEGA domain-containing protein [Lachnospiraceae bacterium 45-W7]